jgi:Holliday junction resolvase RusA-like endonuclease
MHMVRAVDFTIPGRTAGKGRPRATVQHGKVRTYTPAKTRVAEGVVRFYAKAAMGGAPLLEGPLKLSVWMSQQPPPSWPKKKKMITRWITGKPDADNTIKLIADSMNNIVYRDDAQISQLEMWRFYAADEPECVRVRVETLQ